MGGMKKPLKILLGIIAVAMLVCIVWLILRPGDPAGRGGSDTSRGPTFEVRVDKPRMDRFLFGILPTRIEERLSGGGELRFGHASRGAKIGDAGHDRLDLSADGWNLFIETDGAGRVAPGTRLVFPIEIAEKRWTLRCRPADTAVGYLHAATRAGSDVLDGRFLVEFAACADAETGKILDTEAGGNPGDAWPSEPLTVSGSFEGLPQVRR
jgi:hypothetical protein